MNNTDLYTVGGTVPTEGKIYIQRQADEELLALCRAGSLAYVLSTRQVGKSSLMVRTARQLETEGMCCAVVDLSLLGTEFEGAEWYLGLLFMIDEHLELSTDIEAWWEDHAYLSGTQRLVTFFQHVIIEEIGAPIVIFLDEIDSTLSLPFTSDFFAAIRALYNARARVAALKRLTFVLIGVATPSNLISDPKRTPFNIGQRVELTDFTLDEAAPLAKGFALPAEQAQQVLACSLKWTGGHPYLTQRLCVTLLEQPNALTQGLSRERQVDQVVASSFFGEKAQQDSNLRFVRGMLTERAPDQSAVLSTYRDIRLGRIVRHEPQSLIQRHLKLSGVVCQEGNKLRIRNRIYEDVFNWQWIKKQLVEHHELNLYTVGGTVKAKGKIYIQRQADQELLELCRAGTFAYVLAARQVGKSSLMVQTAQQLEAEGTRCALVDLSSLGSQFEGAEWYLGLLHMILDSLRFTTDLEPWWQRHAYLSGTQRLVEFFQKVIVEEIADPIVIFLDEIDSTLNLPVASDFFAAIRALYNARTQVAALQRLTFVLIGVAAPSNLISDPKRTPFNIGQRVELRDFTLDEAAPLGEGLSLPADKTEQVLAWLLKWTGGHPYLTQRLCVALLEEPQQIGSQEGLSSEVERVVARTFFGSKSEEDNHLQFVRDMLTKRAPDTVSSGMEIAVLSTYRDIRQGRLVPHDPQSLIQNHLKLSGIVYPEDNTLRVRNRIYEEVFDQKWIKEQWPLTWWQTLPRSVKIASGMMAVMFVMLLFSLDFVVYQQQVAVERAQEAEQAALKEKEAREATEKQVRIATARQLTVQSQLAQEKYPQRSLLLAVEALQTTMRENEPRVREAEQALRDALANTGGIPLSGHEDSINAVAISPDNHWLVTASNDKTARLWDLTDPAATPIVLIGHENSIEHIAISPDNHWLVTASNDGTARLWDLTADDPAASSIGLTDHKNSISDVAISPDNHWLVTASTDTTARLWDLTANDPAATPIVLTDHESPISAVAISRDNRRLVTASYDGTVRLWDLTANNPAATPIGQIGHEGRISDIAISPDNRWLVTGGYDGTARLWDLTANDLAVTAIVLAGHESIIGAIAVSPDNHWLVTGSHDGIVRLWDLTANDPAATAIGLTDHESPISAVAISRDNRRLVTASYDGTVRLWDLTANNPAATPIGQIGHEGRISDIAISPDNRWLVTGGYDGTARLWDLTIDNLAAASIVLTGHENGISDTAISSDNRWLATGSYDGTARLWDLTDPAATPIVPIDHEDKDSIWDITISSDNRWLATGSYDGTAHLWGLTDPAATPIVLNGHKERISDIAISPDSRWLVTGGHDGTAHLWDLTVDDPAARPIVLNGHENSISDIAISPDNRWLVTGSEDNTARLWDLTVDDPAATPIVLAGHKNSISGIAVSPDNHWLVTGSEDKTARLWDLTANEPAATSIVLTGHENWIWHIAISPDNRWLVTGSLDKTARLWDLTVDDPAASAIVLIGHERPIRAVAISPDNRWLVTGSDGSVRLWDLTVDDPAVTSIVLTSDDEGLIPYIAISPDNHWLVKGNSDGTIRLWNLRIDELIELACRTTGRNLSQEEWTQYFGKQAYRNICPDWPVHYSVVHALQREGQNLAKKGDIEGAIAKLREAFALEPTSEVDSEVEIPQLLASALVERGEELAEIGNIGGAIAQFQEALQLDPTFPIDPQQLAASVLVERGEQLAKSEIGNTKNTIAKFQEALQLDPNFPIEAHSLNTLCWFGSLSGHAALVMDACERAVDLAPDNGVIRGNRGLARALTGDYAGAIEDFEFYVEWSKENELYERYGSQPEAWITELEAGRNPFDAETLEMLRSE